MQAGFLHSSLSTLGKGRHITCACGHAHSGSAWTLNIASA